MANNNILFHAINEDTANIISRFNEAIFARSYFKVYTSDSLKELESDVEKLNAKIEQAGLANKPVDKLVKDLQGKKSALARLKAERSAVTTWCNRQIKGNKKEGIAPVKSMLPKDIFKDFQAYCESGNATKYRKDVRDMIASFGLDVDDKCIKKFAEQLYGAVGTAEKARDKDIVETGEGTNDTSERTFEYILTAEVCKRVTRKCNKLPKYTNDTHKAIASFAYSTTDEGVLKAVVESMQVVELTDSEKKAVAEKKAEAEAVKAAKKATKKARKNGKKSA